MWILCHYRLCIVALPVFLLNVDESHFVGWIWSFAARRRNRSTLIIWFFHSQVRPTFSHLFLGWGINVWFNFSDLSWCCFRILTMHQLLLRELRVDLINFRLSLIGLFFKGCLNLLRWISNIFLEQKSFKWIKICQYNQIYLQDVQLLRYGLLWSYCDWRRQAMSLSFGAYNN